MIASLCGIVRALNGSAVVIEVGGIGVLAYCTPATLAQCVVGQNSSLSTSLIVREDSLTLYGFITDDERGLFELLMSANGVGPKVALAVLATHPARVIRQAIATADLATLTAVPGIGKKGAERIVLDLRDKIGLLASGLPDVSILPVAPWRDQLETALVGLGWSTKEAEQATTAMAPQAQEAIAANGQVDIAQLLRGALRILGRS
ncbi:MAG: Holliday junction branch migration protein RuvA [Antricoccus sp.]